MLWNVAAAIVKAMVKPEDAERFWQPAIALKPLLEALHVDPNA